MAATNLIRDDIADGWRAAAYTDLTERVFSAQDMAEAEPDRRYEWWAEASELQATIEWVEVAAALHEQAFYRRLEATYGLSRHWTDDPKAWANEPVEAAGF